MTLDFISLFSGIGGIDLGLERAGMRSVAQVEIDPYCQAVLSTHWPEVPKYGDVYNLSGSALPAAHAICGGFPCQPVSMAGRRQGKSDPRWLWPEFARLVGEIRPRYVIVENVPGIYSLGGTEIVADLATMGYDAEWGSFPAKAFGAPHERQRFVLVAHTDTSRWDGSRVHEVQRESVLLAAGSGGGSVDSVRVGGGEGEELANSEILSVGTRLRQVGAGGVGDGRSGNSRGPRRLLRRPGAWDEHWRHDPADFSESGVGRVANGVPNRVDRIRSLGNSVVPQVFEHVGRAVMRDARKRGYID